MIRLVPLVFLTVVFVGCSNSMTAPTASTAAGSGSAAIGPPANVPPDIEPPRGRPDIPGPPAGVPRPQEPGDATPVTYLEAVSGDLPDSGSLTSVGVLGNGLNTVSGTTSFISSQGGSVADHDAFTFEVPAGLVVTHISYEWVLTPVEGPVGELFSADIDYGLSSQSGSSSLSVELFDNASISAGTVSAFADLLPGGAGVYELTTTGDGTSGLGAPGESLGWTVEYTWTLTVSSP
jgi:hypothetical protein